MGSAKICITVFHKFPYSTMKNFNQKLFSPFNLSVGGPELILNLMHIYWMTLSQNKRLFFGLHCPTLPIMHCYYPYTS